jgi:hypothetical protein
MKPGSRIVVKATARKATTQKPTAAKPRVKALPDAQRKRIDARNAKIADRQRRTTEGTTTLSALRKLGLNASSVKVGEGKLKHLVTIRTTASGKYVFEVSRPRADAIVSVRFVKCGFFSNAKNQLAIHNALREIEQAK